MSNMDNFSVQDHNRYMKIALNLAIKGRGKVSPNPMVGCIIVKDDRIISIGYNGMPSGASNVCEVDGESKPEVLHAEANAITKLANLALKWGPGPPKWGRIRVKIGSSEGSTQSYGGSV